MEYANLAVCGILEQCLQFALLQRFDDFTHVLRAIARANQERVRRFDDHQIANSDGGDKFARAP